MSWYICLPSSVMFNLSIVRTRALPCMFDCPARIKIFRGSPAMAVEFITATVANEIKRLIFFENIMVEVSSMDDGLR